MSQTELLNSPEFTEELSKLLISFWRRMLVVGALCLHLSSLLEGEKICTEKTTVTFKIICQQFLPRLSMREINGEVFSKISNWLRNVVISTYEWIKQEVTVSNNHEPFYQRIHHLCVLLECLIDSVEQISTLKAQIYVEDADNVIPVLLNVILTSFSHCKEQNAVYGDYMEIMKEPLDSLFEKCGLLWLKMNSLLVKLYVRQSNDVDFTVAVLDVVVEIADVGFENVRVMTSLWKLYAKLTVENIELLQNQLDIDSALTVLIKQFEDKLRVVEKLCHANDNLGNNSETIILKLLRICGFIFKIVVLLCEKFNANLHAVCKHLLRIILLLNTYSLPSLEAFSFTKCLHLEMTQQLTVGVEPLVGYLIENDQFISLVLTADLDFTTVTPFAWCLLFISILQKLPSLDRNNCNRWLVQDPFSILHRIYNILPYCHSELMLPVYLPEITCRGNLPREVSFYEYLLVRMCAFTACVAVRHFSILESVLLENLLHTNYWCRQLSADVWAFLGRYSLPELCYHHCITLAEIVMKCKRANVIYGLHIISLVNRLITFLAEEHLEVFLSTSVGMKFLELCIQKRSAICLMPTFSKILLTAQSNFSSIFKPQSILRRNQLIKCLKILSTGMQTTEGNNQSLFDPAQINHLTQAICSTWNSKAFEIPIQINERADWDLVERIINITSMLMGSFKDHQLVQILTTFRTLISRADEISRFQIVKCLRALSCRSFNAHTQQSMIFGTISDLFSALLSDNCWLVRNTALDAFCAFSHGTKHESIIIQTVNRVNGQQQITNYLNKIPFQSADVKDIAEFLKSEQMQLLTHGYSQEKSIDVNSEQTNETGDQEQIMQRLEESLTELEKKITEFSAINSTVLIFPNWAKERLNIIEQKLHSFHR